MERGVRTVFFAGGRRLHRTNNGTKNRREDQKLSFQHQRHSCAIRQGDLLARIAWPFRPFTDVVASQVVGDVRANLLRAIAPKGSHGEMISENFVHLFYEVRVKSFNTIEILLRGDTGRPIPFLGGVVEVTLHFRKGRQFLHGVTQQCQSTNVS